MLLRLPSLLLLCLQLSSLSSAAPNPVPAAPQAPLGAPSTAPQNDPISQDLYDELEELSRIVDIAYCVGSLNTGVDTPFECLSFCKDFPSFELKQTWNTGLTLSDSCGYIALSHPPAPPRIIVAFRGTYSIVNALADLSFNKQEYIPYPSEGHNVAVDKCEGCFVHAGFLESWSQSNLIISDVVAELVKLYPEYPLTLVGHSLGGAVAALAGLDFQGRGWNPTVTTFGEPKVGNLELAEYFNRKFTPDTYRRVTHAHDPVPLVPLTQWGYVQHGYEYYISASQLPYTRCDIRLCEGNEDATCIARENANALQLFWAHRDYFHRMGLCVPVDSFLRKIRVLDAAEYERERGEEEVGVRYFKGGGEVTCDVARGREL